jgi:hypothetical protein
MKKIALLMMLAAILTNGWAQDLITPHQDNSVSGTENDHAWVDLGLPSGLKWATCNVGATNPWHYGNYFAWGETAPKSTYNWSTYLDGRITKSEDCGTDKDLLNGITDISGTQYDAARTNMGGDWRMPTTEEQNELVENCYWEWTDSYNGKSVSGYIVYRAKDDSDKGKKKTKEGENSTTTTLASYSLADAHIFFPAAGAVYVGEDYDGLHGVGNWGDYWSSSFYVDDPGKAYYKTISMADVLIRGRGRGNGRSVRGVYDSSETTAIEDTKESESINIVKYIDARGNVHIVLPDGRVYNIVGASVK